MRRKKGQGILEYVILLSAIVVAVIAGIVYLGIDRSTGTVDGTKGLGKVLNNATQSIGDATTDMRTTLGL